METIKFHDGEGFGRTIWSDIGDGVADMNGSALDGADTNTSDKVVVIQQSGLPLEFPVFIHVRGRQVFQDTIE